jgi:hypothetical protein
MGEFFDKIQIFPGVDIALYVKNSSLSPGVCGNRVRQWDNFNQQNQARHMSAQEN